MFEGLGIKSVYTFIYNEGIKLFLKSEFNSISPSRKVMSHKPPHGQSAHIPPQSSKCINISKKMPFVVLYKILLKKVGCLYEHAYIWSIVFHEHKAKSDKHI